jgi:hypothetical protein
MLALPINDTARARLHGSFAEQKLVALPSGLT